MKKTLRLSLLSLFLAATGYSQSGGHWAKVSGANVKTAKHAQRNNFPRDYQLFKGDFETIKQQLLAAPDRFKTQKSKVVISLPNAEGNLERFEMFEASNFAPELQERFPEIRSYIGKGLDDVTAQVRLSVDPSGIQTMIFRTDKRNEFMEPYSEDGKIYAVYNSSRNKGDLPFTCSTEDKMVMGSLADKTPNTAKSNTGELLNFRLAMSCNGEYTQYFGGTKPQALAAMNSTMTRVNGVFEKDFTIHMTIIANTDLVIFTNAATDPYTTMANWNAQLQTTLTNTIGEANYDVGHMFGASGGGGNAGCIGCVCVDGQKGSGITSPANGVPMGDTFDIDYVAHELGHQFGANHTFSHNNEGSGVNVEPGSGSTIMGYAGITNQDVQPNSDDYFHFASIFQVQTNMEGKTCPTRTAVTNNAPVVNAGLDYTIPRSTPFILTGTATDADGNPITYCWEQIDNASNTQTGSNSAASATKATGPNWRSYDPTTSPSRYFPPLARVIANQTTTVGTDITVEALSSVARTLNFALTVRDNAVSGPQTNTDNMTVTVNAIAGPFQVTAPNTAVSWAAGTTQTVTWNVAGTTANGVNTAYVDIYLSNDGGNTYPTLLASKVPNDGTETVTIPNTVGTTNRIMVKGNNHIFYDISNNNFTITAPASTFAVGFNGVQGQQNKVACQGASVSYTIPYTTYGGFSGTTTFSVTGIPGGATATFSPTSINANGNVTLTISNTNGAAVALYPMVVTATSGVTSKTVPFYLDLVNANFGTQNLTSPANLATAQSTTTILTWPANAAATLYDVQVASDAGFTSLVANTTVSTTSYAVAGLAQGTTYYWRVMPKNAGCSGTYSTTYSFMTGQSNCAYSYSNNTVINVPDGTNPNVPGAEANKTITIPASVTGNINDVNVSLSFNHAYIDDLVVWMTHPDGTAVYLWNRNCENEFSSVNVTFDDGNPFISASSCTASTGTFSPDTPLAALNGKPAAGTWTLRARDYWNGDIGTVNNWSINVCVAENLSTSTFGINDLVIYPNPNNGNFNVKFDSNSGNEIKIAVYDMRGRLVFENNYKNTGIINQTVEINNAESGIYLVTIQDGDRKETKKISIK